MRNRSFTPYFLIAPSFLLAAFIVLYPLYDIASLSLHQVNRFGQMQGFTGFANFERILADPLFWPTVLRSLFWTLAVVAGTVLVSIPVAMILSVDFYGRGIARVIVMLPWAISVTMTAVVWRWALNGQSGYLNRVLQDTGVISDNIIWLADAGTAFPVQILIGILVSIPFTVTVLMGGLASIPRDIVEAARVEGASDWHVFRTITLPLLKPFVTIVIVLNVIYVFNSFPIIWVLTQGGPANSTDILVTYLYKLAFRFGRMGDAAAVSLFMFSILIVFTLIYVRLVSRNEEAAA